MSVILVACSPLSFDLFERLKSALESNGVAAEVARHKSGTDLKYEGKRFALVGVMGSLHERQSGLKAVKVVGQPSGTCALGLCFDIHGCQWYGMQLATPPQTRIRVGVFLGSRDKFPIADALVRPVCPRIFTSEEEWQTKLPDLVEAVKVGMSRLFCG